MVAISTVNSLWPFQCTVALNTPEPSGPCHGSLVTVSQISTFQWFHHQLIAFADVNTSSSYCSPEHCVWVAEITQTVDGSTAKRQKVSA